VHGKFNKSLDELPLRSPSPAGSSMSVSSRSLSRTSSSSSSSLWHPTTASAVVLANRFQLGSEIGRGGEGVVVWAIDLANDKTPVALKRRHCNDTAELQEAMQEALMLARITTLGSPHFAAFIDSHVDTKVASDKVFYDLTIAQEHIAGGDLLRKLAACAPHAIDRLPLARWCHQLCVAVGTLHANGIVHRDIKPENILLRSDTDTLVLCDFGCAVMSNSRSPSASHVVGSTVYLAPELMNAARGSVRPSFAADAWAVGVVLLDVASGMLNSQNGTYKIAAIAAAAQKNAANTAKWRAHLDECLRHLLPDANLWSGSIQSLLRLDASSRIAVAQAAAILPSPPGERSRAASIGDKLTSSPSRAFNPRNAGSIVLRRGSSARCAEDELATIEILNLTRRASDNFGCEDE
jgi:serine/threonine protein kinase